MTGFHNRMATLNVICEGIRPFLTRKFFQEILGLEESKKFLGKFRQAHNLNISDRLLRSKTFFQENIPGFICSVFRST